MASGLIHICVAKEINKYLKRNEEQILLGSIAPDIAKLINISRDKTHFIDEKKDIPNIENFLKKYKNNLDNDFIMGYYIHLYTDYLWFSFFIPNLLEKDKLIKINNKKIKYAEDKLIEYVYNDYSALNKQLIEQYNIDLSFFKITPPKIENIIEEIPLNKLNILIEKQNSLINESKKNENILFDNNLINSFIEFSVNDILANIDNLNNKKD